MDFPVEATVHLNNFPNKMAVKQILRSHGLTLTDLSGNQVRVKGMFSQLKAARASLELPMNSPTETDMMPGQQVSSGAVSKHYNNHSSGISRRLGFLNKAVNALSPSRKTSSFRNLGFSNNHSASPNSRSPDLRRPSRSARYVTQEFDVDADVFMYARQIHKKKIDDILHSHNVRMKEEENGDDFRICVLGKSAAIASGKLKSFLDDLLRSLRTQDVPLRDMDRQGWALLDKIKKSKNIHNLVLVREMHDKLHLVGPSRESYELKQRLLGTPVDQSGRTGRTLDRANGKRRSSSLPSYLKSTHRNSGSAAYPSPAGAAGYTPSKYRDVIQDVAEPQQGGAEYDGKKQPVRATNGVKMPKALKFMKVLSPKEIRKKIKSHKQPWK